MLSDITNQRERDKFVESGGETAIRVVSDNNTAVITNLPTEYPLPTAQITTLTPPAAITGYAKSSNQTDGSQRTQIRDQFGYTGDATPNSEILVANKIRLVGTIFNGSTFDTNFWVKGSLVNGTVAQTGSEMIITSGAAAADYAGFYSVRRANWITGTTNKFRCQMRLQEAADADLVRRWGVGYAATLTATAMTDGAWFQLDGTALSVVTAANDSTPTDTTVDTAHFNGTYVAPTWTNNNTFEILYTLGKVYFLINNVIIHTVTASTTHWTYNTTNFYIFADANTIGDGSTAKTMTFRMINISRLGSIVTKPTYRRISGVAATYVLKYGGGVLHRIIFNNTTGTSLTVYDDSAATGGKEVALITTTTTCVGSWDYSLPFFNGLTVKTIGDNLDATIIYE